MRRRFQRVIALLMVDILLVQASVWLALALRLDGQGVNAYWLPYLPLSPFVIAGTLAIAALSGLYVSLWRYASIPELIRICVVGAASSALLAIATLVLPDDRLLPRSVPAIYALLFTAALGASRLSLRALRRWRYGWPVTLMGAGDRRTRVLIVGAGDAGVMMLEELRRGHRLPVGFVDDDPGKAGMKIRGIRVLGTTADVPDLVRRLRIDEVLLAMPSAPAGRIRELVEAWRKLPARLSTVPRINDLIDGRVTVSQIRPVALEDLLSRPPVRLDTEAIGDLIRGRRVLVTGAGGSIGSELCRQISRFAPAELVMLGHGENSLFEAEQMMLEGEVQVRHELVIADIRDRSKVDWVFARYRPELVFHAAAHKHVPFMEDNPDEACKTNVFGTQNLAEAAIRYGVERFVLISTDKAVNPSSIMGATKRVAEMVVRDLNRLGKTRFVAVRFGNVLGSRGSVVPLFQRQIARGGPVTITDPEMKRYFMTIPEAAQLVLQAAAMGEGGEVFVLDMGEPVRIVDLARQLITLSGFEPDKDIPIVFTGRRPGEKVFEELLTAEEGTEVTHHERVYVARGRVPEPETFHRLLRELESALFVWDGVRNGHGDEDKLSGPLAVERAVERTVEGPAPASVEGADLSLAQVAAADGDGDAGGMSGERTRDTPGNGAQANLGSGADPGGAGDPRRERIVKMLMQLVPSYRPDPTHKVARARQPQGADVPTAGGGVSAPVPHGAIVSPGTQFNHLVQGTKGV